MYPIIDMSYVTKFLKTVNNTLNMILMRLIQSQAWNGIVRAHNQKWMNV